MAVQVFKEGESLLLENPYLRLTVAGGRVASLVDKRSGREWLTEGGIVFRAGLGEAGPGLLSGFRSPRSDDEAGLAFLWGLKVEEGLSWQATVSLGPEEAAVDVRLAVFNRRLYPVSCSPWIEVAGEGKTCRCWFSQAGHSLALAGEELFMAEEDGRIRLGPQISLSRAFNLFPHRTLQFTARLLPLAAMEGALEVGTQCVLSVHGEDLVLAVARPRPRHKVLLGLEDGQTVEAVLDMYPEQPAILPIGNLPSPPMLVIVRAPLGEEILRVESVARPSRPVSRSSRALSPASASEPDPLATTLFEAIDALHTGDVAQASRLHFKVATHHPGLGNIAHFCLGLLAMQDREWQKAAHAFEESLLYCGNDPLAWWLKHWCLRMLDEPNEHDLPNAHYLSPLEPALRADAFLNAPVTEEADPAKLLDELGNEPQVYLEVAELLRLAGLMEELDRWLSAGILRAPDPMTHLLRADAFLGIGKEIAAGEEIAFAAQMGPASAKRPTERAALRRLSERFPEAGIQTED